MPVSSPFSSIEPLALPIFEAVRFSGLSRSEIYRRLQTNELRAVKSGSRTLIMVESLREYLANLPPATFRPKESIAA